MLAERGFFPQEWLATYGQPGSRLPEQMSPGCVPGVEAATGSLGHGLSLGAGMALAGRIQRREYRVWVVLSDGECNEGSVWEAAMFAAARRLTNVLAVVDFNRWQATGRSEEVLALSPLADKWAAFGWQVSEVNGHDIGALRGAIGRWVQTGARAGVHHRPDDQGARRVVHGRRQQLALPHSHGGRSAGGAGGVGAGMRNAFARELTRLAAADERIVLLMGDIGNRLFDDFKSRFPERFFNCGVAEANMMSMAAGMALCGLRPVVYTIVPFVTTRCLEQIRVDVCYHHAPVVIVGVGGGLSYASLGATHQACEDIALLRVLPGMQDRLSRRRDGSAAGTASARWPRTIRSTCVWARRASRRFTGRSPRSKSAAGSCSAPEPRSRC